MELHPPPARHAVTNPRYFFAGPKDLKLQGNPAYLRLDGQRRIRILGLIVGLSFLPALVHIWYLASYMGSKWS